MSRRHAKVYFYVSNCDKICQIHNSDIFQLQIRIPDKNSLFATLCIHFSEIKLVICPLKSIFRTVALENQVSCGQKCLNYVLKLIYSQFLIVKKIKSEDKDLFFGFKICFHDLKIGNQGPISLVKMFLTLNICCKIRL